MLSLSEVAKLYPGILAGFPRLQSFEKVLRSPETPQLEDYNQVNEKCSRGFPISHDTPGRSRKRNEGRGTGQGERATGNGQRATGNGESVKRGISKPDG